MLRKAFSSLKLFAMLTKAIYESKQAEIRCVLHVYGKCHYSSVFA